MENRAYENYKDGSSRDFICDPFFQDWVIAATEAQDYFWQHFLEQYPAAGEQVQEARQLLQGIQFKEEQPSEEMAAAAFERHWLQVNESEKKPGRTLPFITRRVWRVAAVFITVVAMAAGLWRYRVQPGRQLVQTPYGGKRSIVLPDGSLVILNANSAVTYAGNWTKEGVREVWLQGEGYFNVKHDGPALAQPFRVHTGSITVEVLGTRFDIRQRRNTTEVALEAGKIALHFAGKQRAVIVMKPGEVVVYNHDKEQVIKDTANTMDYSAWKQNTLVLRNPTVQQITQYLEDNFGYRILLEDTVMWNRKVNGPILYDNLNDALFILSTVLNTKVIKTDSTIILRPR